VKAYVERWTAAQPTLFDQAAQEAASAGSTRKRYTPRGEQMMSD
jgi:hypothetical protein